MRFTGLLALSIAAVFLFLAGCAGPALGNGSLRILVLGENGVPLSGAKVVSNDQPEGQLKLTGLTDGDGRVTFNDIKAGDYEFYVSRFDYDQAEFSVTLAVGHNTDITINLARAPAAPPAS